MCENWPNSQQFFALGCWFWYKSVPFWRRLASSVQFRGANRSLITPRQPETQLKSNSYLLRPLLRSEASMSRVCQVTGKRPVSGNNVSHAMNHTRRRFLPNLQSKRFWVESEKRFVRLRTSTKGMRIIDKKGIDAVLADLRARGEKV